MKRVLLIAAIASGCASNLPMTSTINDFVVMGIESNMRDTVSFSFSSSVRDSVIIPFRQGRSGTVPNHPGFKHAESLILGMMLKEYMSNKFSNLAANGQIDIRITLVDFWLELYSTDSAGKAVLAALVGGEINNICVAKVKVRVDINKNGAELTKTITSSAEEVYIAGIGTGTSTSYIHQGSASVEHTFARSINSVNNKVLMLLNAHLEGIGL